MTQTETCPIGTMERLRRCEEALRDCDDLFVAIRDDYTDPRSECREGRAIIYAALTPMTKPEQEGV